MAESLAQSVFFLNAHMWKTEMIRDLFYILRRNESLDLHVYWKK